MNRLFVGTSISGHVDYETGEIHPKYRAHVESILTAIRKTGEFSVFCAVEYEGWRINPTVKPGVGVRKDLAEIATSDIVLALLPTPAPPPAPKIISGGLQFEAGHGVGLGKRVILATERHVELDYFNQGVVENGLAAHFQFDSPNELAQQLGAMVSSELRAN